MSKKSTKNLHAAKREKNDEFYTRLEDIERELYVYGRVMNHFKDKVVLLPCDESEHTNFFKHFMMLREEYGWKSLICVGYRENRPAEIHAVENYGPGEKEYRETNLTLDGNGDFRLEETQALFDMADVVVTNPPFSLFREFVALLEEKKLKYLIIGNLNAITYKEIFPLLRENKMWLGYNNPNNFYDKSNDMQLKSFGNIGWFTNLEIPKRYEELNTGIDYKWGDSNGWYKKYDNYDAININRCNHIPMDYDGIMGVPITFLSIYNPNQFEILGCTQRGCHDDFPDIKKYNDYIEMRQDGNPTGAGGIKTNENGNLEGNDGKKNYFLNPKTGHIVQSTYGRIFIRHKR